MELAVNIFQQHLHCFLLGMLAILHFMLSSSITAATAGKVSAIMVFGDSTVDPGNNNYITTTIAKANYPPYGRDFYGGKATGRFSNGRLVTDFISEVFGLPPTVPAYLDTSNTMDRISTGASFASAGSGLDYLTSKVLSVMPLSQQFQYFKEYSEKLKLAKGESSANQVIAEALYIFSIGSVDIVGNLLVLPARRAQYSGPEYISYIITLADAAVRNVYDLGARKIAFVGLAPLGCTPIVRTLTLKKPGDCSEEYNQLSIRFNDELKKTVSKLNRELAGAQVVYAEIYSLFSAMLFNPGDYGFQNVAQGCCGTGLIEQAVLCSLEEALTCQDDDKYMFFDSIHPTEKAFKILAAEIRDTSLKTFL